jgi:hypothetical protein
MNSKRHGLDTSPAPISEPLASGIASPPHRFIPEVPHPARIYAYWALLSLMCNLV